MITKNDWELDDDYKINYWDYENDFDFIYQLSTQYGRDDFTVSPYTYERKGQNFLSLRIFYVDKD
jgi:hypothetical protein